MTRRKKILLGAGSALLLGAVLLWRTAPIMSPGALLHVGLGWGTAPPPAGVVSSRLRAAPGFSVTRFAQGLGNVRFLRFTAAGDLLASVPRAGKVLLLGRAGGAPPRTLIEGLRRPHGMDLQGGYLYIAETDAVGRVRFDEKTGQTSGPFERVVTGLPGGGNHWTRTVRFGPDGWMYVSIGSSCNVCAEEDRRRAAVVRYRPDGSGEELFATGLRNSVGLDFHPVTGELWATDNGRDLLGDDFPPCELNRVLRGAFYGWPHANGDRVPDPDFGAGHEAQIAASVPPAFKFPAHNAPLGLTFLRSDRQPPGYRGAAVAALHGSWNRTRKDGYKVVSLHWDAAGRIEQRDLLTGFLRPEGAGAAAGDEVIGRPVDVAEGPDGAIYVSDDYAGSIYRVAAGEGQAAAQAAQGAPSGQAAPAAAAAQASQGASPPEPAGPERKAAFDRGAQLFQRFGCAACHVPGQAEKGVVPHRLDGVGRRYALGDLAEYFLAPRPPMPLFPLSPEERRDLAVYVSDSYR